MNASVRLASPLGPVVLLAALLAAFASAVAAFAGMVPASLAVAAGALLALTIGAGVCVAQSGIFARPVIGVRTARRALALTFDDGPDPRWTLPLLDMLEERGHRATFFVIGERAERQAALVAEISRRGHEIANHTWAHASRTAFIHPDRLALELERTNDVIARATGSRPRWFRAPMGLLSPRIPIAVQAAHLRLVAWTASARDGVQFTSVTAGFSRLEKSLMPGAVLVMHDAALFGDREPIACELLRLVLNRMESAGLKSVTLSDLCDTAMT